MIKTIHNAETGEITKVEMTKEEIDEIKKMNDEITKAEAKQNAARAKAEADKAALLARLGLTEDELKTILG